jgi:hypothetical protein
LPSIWWLFQNRPPAQALHGAETRVHRFGTEEKRDCRPREIPLVQTGNRAPIAFCMDDRLGDDSRLAARARQDILMADLPAVAEALLRERFPDSMPAAREETDVTTPREEYVA